MSAITILPANNVPAGPFTREQIAEKLQSGECSLDQLAFIDGLTQWTPLRDILAKLDASAPVPATRLPRLCQCRRRNGDRPRRLRRVLAPLRRLDHRQYHSLYPWSHPRRYRRLCLRRRHGQ